MNKPLPFRIDVFTIFPKLVDDFCSESLLGRARQESLVDLRCHDLRDYGDESRRVDDALYGGGAGMLFRPEPIFAAIEAVQPPRPLLLLSPGGKKFDQDYADHLSKTAGFSLLCGRYEGVDHRVVDLREALAVQALRGGVPAGVHACLEREDVRPALLLVVCVPGPLLAPNIIVIVLLHTYIYIHS